MKPILTSKITQYCLDYRENSFSAVFTIQLNLSGAGQGKSSPPAPCPFSTIEQLLWKTETLSPSSIIEGMTGESADLEILSNVHRKFILDEFSELIQTACRRTMIPISLLGMDFHLTLSLVYSDGITQLILGCPFGGMEGIKEWSSDVLQNIRTVGRGRQKNTRACLRGS